ncbi:ferredoxin [Ancylomarina sp. 16SWW S1-10-2]|uniref:(2Fe-2S) ferredoxin domain-containing protein n=1 Tax=Ancylomarina sp. 16SWW S1-10-2 TaxID=2499681 RepID=UPI0012AE0E38|nr:(2Fe-2S) ferredoxin domain-containing protein [Ancylomarina sp. 16SWW S1-10-2]MRT93389.1 (2Fe-2S) ferredoxin domain-containing protein [Ancylomarina sp. 16SWW S1-10-2]
MAKVKSLTDLKKIKENFQMKMDLIAKCDAPDSMFQVKIAMATCGIASGAKEVMNYFIEECSKRGILALVTQTGCMGYCYAEPTIEVTLPGEEPIVFGDVDLKRANEIIEKYIKNGELVDGIIPVNYNTID